MADFILTPQQHRGLAKNILAKAGGPGYPTKERAAQMAYFELATARTHEQTRTGRWAPY